MSPGKIARSRGGAGPGEAAPAPSGGGPEAAGAWKSWIRVPVLTAVLLLGLGACSRASDRDRGPGLAGHVIEGTPTQGALEVAGPSYRVRGALSHGSSRTLQSTSYRIEQGTLR